MKPRNFASISVAVAIVLSLLSFGSSNLLAQAQGDSIDSRAAQIGYSDGYVKGVRDREVDLRSDYQRTIDYQAADRGYSRDLGERARYQDVYRDYFGRGYDDGVDGKAFTPPAIERGAGARPRQVERDRNRDSDHPLVVAEPRRPGRIPDDTVMRIELLTSLSTRDNREGDTFTARVIEPEEYKGATIEGHVAAAKRAGRVSGTSQLSLAFDTITFKDGKSEPLPAQVEAVYDVENAGKVDSEGKVSGRTTRKRDALTVGIGAGIGTALGAIIGGGAGAGIGAAVGGAAGAATVLATRGEDLDLRAGTELQIRTAGRKTEEE